MGQVDGVAVPHVPEQAGVDAVMVELDGLDVGLPEGGVVERLALGPKDHVAGFRHWAYSTCGWWWLLYGGGGSLVAKRMPAN